MKSPLEKADATRREQQASPQLDLVAIWTRRLTYATALIGILATVIGLLQWRDLQNNSEQTKLAVQAAQRQSEAMTDLAESAKEQTAVALALQRSYVGAFDAAIDYLESGRTFKVYAMVRNFGEPTTVYRYEAHRLYNTENAHQLLADDARNTFVPECRSAGLDEDALAKHHTALLGVIFPTENHQVSSLIDDTTADQDIIQGNKTFVTLSCLIYKVGIQIKHTLSCSFLKGQMEARPGPSPLLPGASPKYRLTPCETAAFAE